jgi:hypothetical protein
MPIDAQVLVALRTEGIQRQQDGDDEHREAGDDVHGGALSDEDTR